VPQQAKKRILVILDILASKKYRKILDATLKNLAPEIYNQAMVKLESESGLSEIDADKLLAAMGVVKLQKFIRHLNYYGFPFVYFRGRVVELTPDLGKLMANEKIKQIQLKSIDTVRAARALTELLDDEKVSLLSKSETDSVKRLGEDEKMFWAQSWLIKHPRTLRDFANQGRTMQSVNQYINQNALTTKILAVVNRPAVSRLAGRKRPRTFNYVGRAVLQVLRLS